MTFFQIEVFMKVVETGNFTKAGEILGLTQSGVSYNISNLESELGIVLLNRGKNGISLTDAGERMIRHMRNILAEAEQIHQKTAAIQGLEIGKVKIGSFQSVSAKLLPGILSLFKRLHPGIEIEFYEGGYNEIAEWVGNGVVDVGFETSPISGFEFLPLFKDKLVVLVPDGHTLQHSGFLTIEHISEEPFIMQKAGCERLVKERFHSAGHKPNVQFEIEDNQTIISMVQEGIGVTIIPRLALPKNLANVSLAELVPETYRTIGLVAKSMKDCTPAVKEFIKAAQSFVSSADEYLIEREV